MRPLIEKGHVYCAQPPLFSTLVGKEKVYLKDEAARQRFLAERPNHKAEFNRLKGLGEMDWRRARADHHGRQPAAPCCRSTSSRRPSPTRSARS